MENSSSKECTACNGYGYTDGRKALNKLVRLLMLAGSEAVRGQAEAVHGQAVHGLHPWLMGIGIIRVSFELGDLTSLLAGRRPYPSTGHDAVDEHVAAKKIVKAAGLDLDTWGICPLCKGKGELPVTEEPA